MTNKNLRITKRIADDIDFAYTSNQISNLLSKQFKWNQNDLDWFVFMDTITNNSVRSVVWIVSKQELNTTIGANSTKILKDTNKRIIDSFEGGSLKISINFSSESLVSTSMSSCGDIQCNYIKETYSYPYVINSAFEKQKPNFLLAQLILLIYLNLFH